MRRDDMAPLFPPTAEHLSQKTHSRRQCHIFRKGNSNSESFWGETLKEANKQGPSQLLLKTWRDLPGQLPSTCEQGHLPCSCAPRVWAPPASRTGLGFPTHSAQSHFSSNKTGTIVLANYFSSLFFCRVGDWTQSLLIHARQSPYHWASFPACVTSNAWWN